MAKMVNRYVIHGAIRVDYQHSAGRIVVAHLPDSNLIRFVSEPADYRRAPPARGTCRAPPGGA
jgi:hypothetical protein